MTNALDVGEVVDSVIASYRENVKLWLEMGLPRGAYYEMLNIEMFLKPFAAELIRYNHGRCTLGMVDRFVQSRGDGLTQHEFEMYLAIQSGNFAPGYN